MFSMVIVEISAESVKACSFHQRKYIPDTEIINMPGGTLWGQAQLRIFDRKFLPALKITKLVFFLKL
jgi:hypothetical protein